ncbi:uncharacterized protein DEA37_0004569 [Paragonimus westermani]|uniref:LIM zinc-binding domain-containing protein n=1 Tax=Paragonimus westermani TaxID=34504 RepID=A0A5J4P263_9TREM|nr:uncharacterized protein DEA37_0004569 [Paragonimus westermani]
MLWNRFPFMPPIFPPFPDEFNPRVPLTAVTCIIPNESRLGKENEPVVVSATEIKERVPVVSMDRPNDSLSRLNGEGSPVCSSESSQFEPTQTADEFPNSQVPELSSNRLFGPLKRASISCSACQRLVNSRDLVIRAHLSIFHYSCFVCRQCNRSLQPGDRYALRGGQPVCQADLLLEDPPSPIEVISERLSPSADYKSEANDHLVQDKNVTESFSFIQKSVSRPPSSQRFGIPSPVGQDLQSTVNQTGSDRVTQPELVYPNGGALPSRRPQHKHRSLGFSTPTTGSQFSTPSICTLPTRATELSEHEMLSHYFLSASKNPHLDCNVDQERFTCLPNPTKRSLSELMSVLEPYSLQPPSDSSPPMMFRQLDIPDPHVPFLSSYLHHSHRSPVESTSGINLPETPPSMSSVSSSGVQFPLHHPTSINALSTRLLVGPKSFDLTFPFPSGLPSQQPPPPGFLKLIEPTNHSMSYVTGSNASSLLMQQVQQKRNRKRRTGLHQTFGISDVSPSKFLVKALSDKADVTYYVKDYPNVWFQNARAKYRRSMLRQENTTSIPVTTGTMARSMGSASELSNPTTVLQTSLSDCDKTGSQSSSTEEGPLYSLDETESEQLDSLKIRNHKQLVQLGEERTQTNVQPLFGVTCVTHDPYSDALAARSRSTSSTTTFDCNYTASSPSSVAYNAFDLSGCRSVIDLCSLNILQS